MKKVFLIPIAVIFAVFTVQAQLYIVKPEIEGTSSNVKFFSEAPVENIEAVNKKATSLLNISTKKVAAIVPIIHFKFEKSLMEEHFNEKYMESDKFPTGTFKGKINEDVDISKDGEYEVSVTGTLKIHGVEQERTIDGTLKKDGDQIIVDSKFKVKLEDHDIDIPSAVVKNIAEVIDVTIHLEYKAKK